jgi:hypothetical protein
MIAKMYVSNSNKNVNKNVNKKNNNLSKNIPYTDYIFF